MHSDLLIIRDSGADARFRAAVLARGRNPDDPWIGGYALHQWQSLRPIWESIMGADFNGRVLEFGCNYGATAIVLAMLGVGVVAIDVDPSLLALARLNAARYGVAERITFVRYNGVHLPCSSAAFDAVVCCSVLEYVPWRDLARVQQEIDRVLRPDGTLIVTGTSNRLWPREMHSRRWLANYLPRWIDRLSGREPQRGVWPWTIRYGFGRYRNLDWSDRSARYLAARDRMPGRSGQGGLRVVTECLRPFGLTPGLVGPSLSLTLRKESR